MKTNKNTREKSRLLSWGILSAIALMACANVNAQMSFLSQSGINIVNTSGSNVILKGVNLGNWWIQEGWMISADGSNPGTQSQMKLILKNQGQTEAQIEAFYASWRTNFIQKADIDFIKSKGMNCIRVPMHYELFLTPAQRAYRNAVIWDKSKYAAYKTQLASWVANNTLATDFTVDGYKIIDNLISWCNANNMYIILDMHAVPGTQGTDQNIADCISTPNDLWLSTVNQDALNAIWKNISTRYKSNGTIAMYDLINEPNNVPNTTTVKNVFQRLITTLRNNGDNHLLMIEGNGWGNNYTNYTPNVFSPRTNLVYNIHRYGTSTSTTTTMADANQIQELGNANNFRNTYQVPIFCGETGLNTVAWLQANIAALNSRNIGWTTWSYKWHTDWNGWGYGRIPGSYPADGAAAMANVLENIKFANLVQNPTAAYWSALAQGGTTTPPSGSFSTTIQAESYTSMLGVTNETTTDTGGGQDVGYIDANDWMAYAAVNIPTAGTYTVQYRVASLSGGGSIQLERSGGANVFGSITVPSTGGWQTWTTISHNVTLPAGSLAFGLKALTGGFNINWFSVKTQGAREAVAVDEDNNGSTFNIYPTVVADQLHIDNKFNSDANVNIIDVTGRIVLQKSIGTGSQTIDVSSLHSGLHFVKVGNGVLHETVRILK
jgi:endoglucanase